MQICAANFIFIYINFLWFWPLVIVVNYIFMFLYNCKQCEINFNQFMLIYNKQISKIIYFHCIVYVYCIGMLQEWTASWPLCAHFSFPKVHMNKLCTPDSPSCLVLFEELGCYLADIQTDTVIPYMSYCLVLYATNSLMSAGQVNILCQSLQLGPECFCLPVCRLRI